MIGSHEPDFPALRPLLGKRIDALQHAWITGDRSERHEIEVVLQLLMHQATNDRSVLLQSPEGNQADGPIRLGRIVHGKQELGWLGVTERELTQHLAVTGRSGSGKSTLCLRLLIQLIERGIPWLIFDYKRSARSLLGLELGSQVNVLALGRDIGATPAFNLLVPAPGVPVETHQRQLVELIADNWYAGDGVIALLERAMAQAYERSAPEFPLISDVKQILHDMPAKSREILWKTSAQRILQQMTTGQLGHILNRRSDAAVLDRLREHWTIIEMDGLATNDANFLVQYIMRYLTQAMLAGPAREQLRFVCLVEEAHHLLARREGAHRETILETCLREGREIGLGIMLADQCISAISPTALANCFTSVCLNARQRSDVQAAAGTLLLSSEQRELLSVLPVGEAVARLSDRWPHPVHIRIPPLPLPKGSVTDADVQRAFLVGPFAASAAPEDSAVPTDPTSDTALPRRGEAVSVLPPPHETPAITSTSRGITTSTNTNPPKMVTDVVEDPLDHDGDLQLLLRSVAAAPLLGVAARFDQLGLSRRKGNALKKTLIAEGYLRAVELPIPAGKTVLLDLTDAARLWLRRHRVNIAATRGSLPHAWYEEWIGRLLREAGWTVQTEDLLNGHRFDLAARRDGRIVLVEVETGLSDWLSNAAALEATRADHRLMLWLDSGSLLRAKAALSSAITLLQPREVPRWVARLADDATLNRSPSTTASGDTSS